MKKKIIATLLTAGLVISTFTACGKTTNNEPTANTEPVVEEQVAEVVEQVVEEEPVEVVDEESVEVIEEQAEETEEPVEEIEEQTEELLPVTEYAWDAYRMTDPSELEIVPTPGNEYCFTIFNEAPSRLVHDTSEEKFQLEDFTWVNESGTTVWNPFTDGIYNISGLDVSAWQVYDDAIYTPDGHYFMDGIDLNEYTGMDIFKTYCDKWGYCDAYVYSENTFWGIWVMSKDNPILQNVPVDFSQNTGEWENIGCIITIKVYNREATDKGYDPTVPYAMDIDFIGEKIMN